MERAIFVCSVIDDLIGTESGASMMASDLEEADEAKPLNNRTRVRSQRSTVNRQYPPAMNRNPWVLKREYCNGRLIGKLERAKRHQHFEVERENGRLVIVLVVSEEDGEEGRDVTCCDDELENEKSPFSVSIDSYIEMGLDVPMASCVVQDPPPSRPLTVVM
ncbi:hypothetical protein K1719_025418 [Acacia pycnantha]|nr:hypothetical protein K1719_025418 [Acacia pycnantha]